MSLAIDIGNTTVGLCGLEGGSVCFEAHLDTTPQRSAAEYRLGIRGAFSACGLGDSPRFEGAVLTSVVPSLTPVLCSCAAEFSQNPPLVAHAGLASGLRLGISQTGTLGMDRLADAAAAAEYYPLPVITVDMGTATTFNVVDRDRVFRGGAIAPGLLTGLNALHEKTAQLPLLEPETPRQAIGTDTTQCILSGTVCGAAALIDGMAARFEEELGEPAHLVLTGGLSRWAAPLCRHPLTRDEHLLVKGLALLYRLNR